MEKSQISNLFSDDKLGFRKAEVLQEFFRLRKGVTPQELRYMIDQLAATESEAKINLLFRIATSVTATYTYVDQTGKHLRISGAVLAAPAKRKLKKAPGYGVMRMLNLICTKKFVERELEETHTDAIHELFDAEKAGDKWLATFIAWRLRVHLLSIATRGLMGWFFSKVKFSVGGKSE